MEQTRDKTHENRNEEIFLKATDETKNRIEIRHVAEDERLNGLFENVARSLTIVFQL